MLNNLTFAINEKRINDIFFNRSFKSFLSYNRGQNIHVITNVIPNMFSFIANCGYCLLEQDINKLHSNC